MTYNKPYHVPVRTVGCTSITIVHIADGDDRETGTADSIGERGY